jgi:hypothetical protein
MCALRWINRSHRKPYLTRASLNARAWIKALNWQAVAVVIWEYLLDSDQSKKLQLCDFDVRSGMTFSAAQRRNLQRPRSSKMII